VSNSLEANRGSPLVGYDVMQSWHHWQGVLPHCVIHWYHHTSNTPPSDKHQSMINTSPVSNCHSPSHQHTFNSQLLHSNTYVCTKHWLYTERATELVSNLLNVFIMKWNFRFLCQEKSKMHRTARQHP
jgi:hypothetical protein